MPRVARLLALAHHFEELLETGAVETQAELAELDIPSPADHAWFQARLLADTKGSIII